LSAQVIGVIPARFASTRFPGKPLVKILGKEMILWVVEAAQKSKSLNELIVATDHDEIFNLVKRSGCRAIMTASDLPTGTDRIYQATSSLNSDIVVNIQGDEPLLQAKTIDTLLQPLLEQAGCEMSTLAHEIDESDLQSQNAVKVILNEKREAIYFSRYPIPFSRQQYNPKAKQTTCYKHIGLYAYRTPFLEKFCKRMPTELECFEGLEQLRALSMGARIKVEIVNEKSIGVDIPEDVVRIENIIKKG
jgi:3-deoxy-manno-octulosonate cytidylyltransferase (CMP-KDO synthetase)